MADGFCIPMFRYRGSFSEISSLTELIGYLTNDPSPFQAWFCFGLLVLCTISITIGFMFRTSVCLYLVLSLYHFFLYKYTALYGYDRILFLLLFILLFSPCSEIFSVDSYRNSEGAEKTRLFPLWTQRLICVQIAFLYFGTGLVKVMSSSWHSGEMLRSIFIGTYANSLAFWVRNSITSDGIWDVLVISVILFELAATYFLFRQRWQIPMMVIGLAFHSGNWIFLGIWRFMVVPLVYILYFHPVDVAEWLDAKLGQKRELSYDKPGSEWWDPFR